MEKSMKENIVDECLRLSGRASCTAVRIYNIIREVGRGELSADNALHQLVEDYHDLILLSRDIGAIADRLEEECEKTIAKKEAR